MEEADLPDVDSDESFLINLNAQPSPLPRNSLSSNSSATFQLKRKSKSSELDDETPDIDINIDTIIHSPEDALNEYFKLKNKYETQIMQNKRAIINSKLSNYEKRQEYLKLKPKCINCKRPGGTIFSIKNYPHTEGENNIKYREFRARCGILADPCNLNITIQTGIYNFLPEIITSIEKELTESKNIIIDNKNKLLFGYITTETALKDFDEEKTLIDTYTSILEEYINEFIDINDNSQKKLELKESLEQSYDIIEQIKVSIRRYNETENTQFVNDAVDLYINTLHPLLGKIMKLKYKQSFVYYDSNDNTFHLIQNKNTIKSLEYSSFTDKVIDFDVGLKANFGKNKNKNKSKTNTSHRDVEENDELEEIMPENFNINETSKFELKPEIIQNGIPRDTPIYGENNTISWNLPQYTEVWNKLPIKLKNVLKDNEDWMEQFMFSCVNLKAKREACKFISPPDLKIPPEQLPNGQYDFGVDIYNQAFNSLIIPKSQMSSEQLQNYEKNSKRVQETYLSQYSVKDGVKNYKMLEDSMNNLVAKALDFNRGFF
jgi:hypothetical protein